MFYVITRVREARIYCQYRVFLYMHVVRHNEREKERPENIVSIECFCTCILYVITSERATRIYCQYRVFLYMLVVRRTQREREIGPNIVSVMSFSVLACCTSLQERERPEYFVSIECFCTCMLYVITRERATRIYCQYRVFLYIHVVRHNEIERERDRPEYSVCVECFCTCMLYVITREREARIYCQYRVFLYMHVVRHNGRERVPNILSVSSVSVHACCTL